jgi:hypothetical protein
MTYLTCTKHRSFQRKHIDVCRQCPDNDECDAFQAHAATEPPAPVEQPPADAPPVMDILIHFFLQELKDIRELVADAPSLQESEPAPRLKNHLFGRELVDFIRSELESIRKLC